MVTAKVVEKDVPVDIAAIGNVEAYATISVRSQVTGQLEQMLFHEGDFVKTGQLLFTLDKRPFEAALEQAEANLVRDKALLAQAEAQLRRDAANAEYMQLTAERQAQLDAARHRLEGRRRTGARRGRRRRRRSSRPTRRNVESARAQLVAQQAAVDNAKVQLDYTIIRSPIDGRTGNLAVKAGNLVTANQTELMTIAQVEPVYVTFSVPAVHLPTIKQHMAARSKLPVTATPQDAEAPAGDGPARRSSTTRSTRRPTRSS